MREAKRGARVCVCRGGWGACISMCLHVCTCLSVCVCVLLHACTCTCLSCLSPCSPTPCFVSFALVQRDIYSQGFKYNKETHLPAILAIAESEACMTCVCVLQTPLFFFSLPVALLVALSSGMCNCCVPPFLSICPLAHTHTHTLSLSLSLPHSPLSFSLFLTPLFLSLSFSSLLHSEQLNAPAKAEDEVRLQQAGSFKCPLFFLLCCLGLVLCV